MINIIVGSGPVGRIMAIALSKSNQHIHLIGPRPTPLPNMAFAIHSKHFKFLNSLNIKPKHQPIHSLTLDFQSPQTFHQKKAICHIVRYNDLLSEISKQLTDIPQSYDKPIQLTPNCIHLPQKSILFKKLIACDGQQSWIRQSLNIETDTFPYDQFAHTAIITHTEAQEGMHQTFRSYGTFGKLTLANPYQSAIVWSCDQTMHAYILEHGLQQALQDHKLIRNLLTIEHHHYIPLKASLSKSYYQDNVFFLGNALHNIHPLLGIGFNLALGDIQTLTNIICLHKPNQHYALKRKRYHTKAYWLSHIIAKSRQYNNYYPIIDKMNTYSSEIKTIQRLLLQQFNSLS